MEHNQRTKPKRSLFTIYSEILNVMKLVKVNKDLQQQSPILKIIRRALKNG